MNRKAASRLFSEFVQLKYIDPIDLEEKVNELKNQERTIVTLNGSFDLMHSGHLHTIYQASLQGDLLIVALNTDCSIQAYKNSLRPIIPLEYRLQMMGALEMVDFVTWFDETNPIETLKKIRPHVHVNSAEYGEDCIEAEVVRSYGGRVHLTELIPGFSTSQIIQKIQKLCD